MRLRIRVQLHTALRWGVHYFTAFARLLIWGPHFPGQSAQVDSSQFHRTEFIVVAVGFANLSGPLAFYHHCCDPHLLEPLDRLETVGGGLQDHQIGSLQVLAGPAFQLFRRDPVVDFLHHSAGRIVAFQQCRREDIRVHIQPDDSSGLTLLFFHCLLFSLMAADRGQAVTLHSAFRSPSST